MFKKTVYLLALTVSAWTVQAEEAFKIAIIDPLSGPMADVGKIFENHLRFAVDQVNARGGMNGVKLEVLAFDNKLSTQETQVAVRSAVEQGVKAIFLGAGSAAVSSAMTAIERNNARNPDKTVMLFNHSSYDPDLVGKQCSFWHFMTDVQVPMRMKAMGELVKKTPDIKKVYFLNPNYSFGQQWAAYGKTILAEARPDIEVVGETFFPTGTVKDFSPYVAKMRAAGADTVVSGSWGNDMTLLVRAAGESGYKLRILTHAGPIKSTLLALQTAPTVHLSQVGEWFQGADNPVIARLADQFDEQYKTEFYGLARLSLAVELLVEGVKKANATDPQKIAAALENMEFDSLIGPMKVRGQDHQVLSMQYVYTTHPVDGDKVKKGAHGTYQGFVQELHAPVESILVPASDACSMKRPA